VSAKDFTPCSTRMALSISSGIAKSSSRHEILAPSQPPEQGKAPSDAVKVWWRDAALFAGVEQDDVVGRFCERRVR